MFVYTFPTLNVMGHGSYLMGHGSHIRWVNRSWVSSGDHALPALDCKMEAVIGDELVRISGRCSTTKVIKRPTGRVWSLLRLRDKLDRRGGLHPRAKGHSGVQSADHMIHAPAPCSLIHY